jgi:hypothetical protein
MRKCEMSIAIHRMKLRCAVRNVQSLQLLVPVAD